MGERQGKGRIGRTRRQVDREEDRNISRGRENDAELDTKPTHLVISLR